MASAVCWTTASEIPQPNVFQSFQPIGGVNARLLVSAWLVRAGTTTNARERTSQATAPPLNSVAGLAGSPATWLDSSPTQSVRAARALQRLDNEELLLVGNTTGELEVAAGIEEVCSQDPPAAHRQGNVRGR